MTMDAHELNIKPQNIKNHCCTCLHKLGSNKHRVLDLEPALIEVFRLCTGYTHLEKEAYPNCLCAQCFDKLAAIEDFQDMSKKSMQFLEELIDSFNTVHNSITASKDKPNDCIENEDAVQNFLLRDLVDPLITNDNFEEVLVKPEIDVFQEIIEQKDNVIDLKHGKELEIVSRHLETNANTSNHNDKKSLRKSFRVKELKRQNTDASIQNQLLKCKFGCGKRFRSKNTAEKHYNTCNLAASAFEHEQDTKKETDPTAAIKASTIKIKIKEKLKQLGCQTLQAIKQENPTNPVIDVNNATDQSVSKSTCPICLKNYSTVSIMNSHLRTHLDERPFQCDKCERGFNKRSLLTNHFRETHGEAPIEIACKFGCGRVFQRHATATNHYRLKHVLPSQGIKPTAHPRICEECGKVFKNITLLKEHSFVHLSPEERPFKCDQCEKRFSNKKNLTEHIMRHKGIKNFECHICGLKKTTRKELNNHMNCHTKSRTYPCTICSKIFNNRTNMKRHEEVVHQGIKRFSCRFCEESFGKLDTLKHHEMRHTGERPHKCQVCNHAFIQVVALKAHMRTHYKLEKLPEQAAQKIVDEKTESLLI